MEEHHFVTDYNRLVDHLLQTKPLDVAMSEAVGGNYDLIGRRQLEDLQSAGLKDGMRLIDFGCGSGRLSSQLGRTMSIDYTGIDVVQSLLDFAKNQSPPGYKFILNQGLAIPLSNDCADFVCAFSVFTHLLPVEIFIYMREIRRLLKPGGSLVCTFLEFDTDWNLFMEDVSVRLRGRPGHLNMHLEQSTINRFCDTIGYVQESFTSKAGSLSPYILRSTRL